jgi:hypothetical protein
MTQQQMFSSFQAKDTTHYSKRSENEPSRNNLKPIRTFGRDISNLNTKESKYHFHYLQSH